MKCIYEWGVFENKVALFCSFVISEFPVANLVVLLRCCCDVYINKYRDVCQIVIRMFYSMFFFLIMNFYGLFIEIRHFKCTI